MMNIHAGKKSISNIGLPRDADFIHAEYKMHIYACFYFEFNIESARYGRTFSPENVYIMV
jgi:hypothetical protein